MIWWDHRALRAARVHFGSIRAMSAKSELATDTIEKIESMPGDKRPRLSTLRKYCEALDLKLEDYVILPGGAPVEFLVPEQVDFRPRLHPWRPNDSWIHSRLMLSVLAVGVRALPSASGPVLIREVELRIESVARDRTVLQPGTVFRGRWRNSLTRANGRNPQDEAAVVVVDHRDADQVWLGMLHPSLGRSDFDAATVTPADAFVSQMLFTASDAPSWARFVKEFAGQPGDVTMQLSLRYVCGARKGSITKSFVVSGIGAELDRIQGELRASWGRYLDWRNAGGEPVPDVEQRRFQYETAYPSYIQPLASGEHHA